MIDKATRLRFVSYAQSSFNKLVSTIVRSTDLPVGSSPPDRRIVEGLLDWLIAEALGSDRNAPDAWIGEARSAREDAGYAAIVSLTFTAIAQSYKAEVGYSKEVAAFLTSRSKALTERTLHREVAADRGSALANSANCDTSIVELLSALESHDLGTCEHSRAVGHWSEQLATNLGLNAYDRRLALVAGTLHDIGKIHTPLEILLSKLPLDADEWIVMREHVNAGAKMLERIPGLQDVAPFVAAHHERPDGKGYPYGLKGSQIAVITRIVSVADSFHAMIGRRPYRPSLSVPAAFDELHRGRGSQFDSDVVDAWFSMLKPIDVKKPRRFVEGPGSS